MAGRGWAIGHQWSESFTGFHPVSPSQVSRAFPKLQCDVLQFLAPTGWRKEKRLMKRRNHHQEINHDAAAVAV
jgi:hypothetical protein